MLTNETRRELLNRAKASGFPGSITDVFQAADQGIDLIEQHQMQQQQEQEMQVANTPQEQEVGLREQHAMGNTQASMAFPDVQPNQSFNTVGMQAPIDIQKIDDQGHLVESYKNVPPGIQDLPTGPSEGTIIESPASYQKGGFNTAKVRRNELKDAINLVVSKEPKETQENMKELLLQTNYLENTMGYNPNAFGRNYTHSQASIDQIMFEDLFSQRVDSLGKPQGFSTTQKKYFKRLEDLGLPSDSTSFKKELRSDNPLAAVAAMRMVYGRSPYPLPDKNKPDSIFNYYDTQYRKNVKIKDKTLSKQRFTEGRNTDFKRGGIRKCKYGCW